MLATLPMVYVTFLILQRMANIPPPPVQYRLGVQVRLTIQNKVGVPRFQAVQKRQ